MKAQSQSSDRISTLPPSIIETILCLLPLNEAGRTSILTREWTYNWTKIPKLLFHGTIHKPGVIQETRLRIKFLNDVYEILLLHHGPIQEFILGCSTFVNYIEQYDRMDQIIVHLLKHNTVMKLLVCFPCELPVSVFSLCQLTDLHLTSCGIRYMSTFNGYGNLTSLYLHNVKISKKALLCILSNNPLLKSFTWVMGFHALIIDDDSTISELFERLPAIENISLGGIANFAGGAVPRVLPASLVHLKYLCMKSWQLSKKELPSLFLLIRSFPKLEKLKLEVSCFINHNWEDYSDIWLDHLVELEIGGLNNFFELELDFVKLILAKSPVLEKVMIFTSLCVAIDEKAKLLTTLLRFPRASQPAEITVN